MSADVTAALSRTAWPGQLRRQQAEALTALETSWADGRTRAWLALPPGAGKTLVGLEAARRLGRQTVVFGPNTAIQAQWIGEWSSFEPETTKAGGDRTLSAAITALTYQSLAVFDPDAEVDEEGHLTLADAGPGRGSGLLARLHENGRALVDALHDAGPITLVLDEAHHLLEVWGALLAELLDHLPDAYVIGLTATPPQTLTADQADLVDRLFGHPIYQASVPGLVRDGYLAPFAELGWLVTPTSAEAAWLGSEAERFAELRTDLMSPAFASVGLFDWLDRRFVSRTGEHGQAVSWDRLERTRPELTTAALRLHMAGLIGLPEGARVREEHRREPTASDWVAVLDDYVKGFLLRSAEPADQAALERIRTALPSIGFQLTRRGIRSGRSPVDRVLARSEAKTHGAVEIAAWKAGVLGDRIRALVLCDHERASATLPARLVGVLDPQAGSARLVLDNLVADARTAALSPMLVTGRTVAAAADTARAFVEFAGTAVELDPVPDDADGIVEVTGRWSSRTWVPLVTRFFQDGHARVLVGTRGLLGEGWNAPRVNTLIDLTTATTPTSVVQTRGRAIRIDPAWPEKVATNWTVVCVSEDHPGGDSDWRRFVRKHDGYLAVDNSGEIIDGVAHVDDQFSPYKPPPAVEFDAVNSQMLDRAAAPERIREAWRIGTPYNDRFVHELRIVRGGWTRSLPAGDNADRRPPVLVPTRQGIDRSDRRLAGSRLPMPVEERREMLDVPARRPVVHGATIALGIAATIAVAMPNLLVAVVAGLLWLLALAIDRRQLTRRAEIAAGNLVHAIAQQTTSFDAVAAAVADGLRIAGLSPAGADNLRLEVDRDGTYRAMLVGVPVAVSEQFATALDEVLAPLSAPRYVVPRYVVTPPSDPRAAGRAWLSGEDPTNAVAYHAVPTVLGVNSKRVAAFRTAWNRWVSAGEPVFTGNPEGAGILAAQRGQDPFAVTTLLRVAWT